MGEYNRQLARLMDEVTRGDVWSLRDLVDEHGRPLVTRVLADGFGVLLRLPEWSDEAIREAIADCQFLPLEETLAVVAEPVIPDEYRGHSAPGTPTNRIARACGSKSGGCAPSCDRWQP